MPSYSGGVVFDKEGSRLLGISEIKADLATYKNPGFKPERQRGWHVQYDGLREGHNFLRSENELTPYDAQAVRLDLQLEQIPAFSRAAELERQVASVSQRLDATRQETEAFPWDDDPKYLIGVGIKSMARSSHADCAPWVSGTSLLHQLHLGRTALPNG